MDLQERLLRATGHQFETLVCGCSSHDVDPRIRQSELVAFYPGIRHAKGVQGMYHWNPARPRTECGQILFSAVARNLIQSRRRLRMYLSLGNPSLESRGVDLFYTYGDYGLATVDLTANPHKHKTGARVIVRPDDFIEGDCRAVGRIIAEILWRSHVHQSTRGSRRSRC